MEYLSIDFYGFSLLELWFTAGLVSTSIWVLLDKETFMTESDFEAPRFSTASVFLFLLSVCLIPLFLLVLPFVLVWGFFKDSGEDGGGLIESIKEFFTERKEQKERLIENEKVRARRAQKRAEVEEGLPDRLIQLNELHDKTARLDSMLDLQYFQQVLDLSKFFQRTNKSDLTIEGRLKLIHVVRTARIKVSSGDLEGEQSEKVSVELSKALQKIQKKFGEKKG